MPTNVSTPALRVVGVDLAAGRGITAVATLRLGAAGERPVFDADLSGVALDDAHLLALVTRAAPTVVAIDAPLSLPAAVRAALGGEGPFGTPASPYTRAAERDPIWSALGVRLFPVSFLGGLTFRAIALLPHLRAALPDASLIEVFPSGTLHCLGLRPAATRTGAAPRPPRQPKTALAARAALHAALADLIDGLPPASPEPLGADHLDALAAALTAAAYARGDYSAVGDPLEGQIILPRSAPPLLYRVNR